MLKTLVPYSRKRVYIFHHMKSSLYIFLLLSSFSSLSAQEATQAHKDSLNALVNEYYRLNLEIFQANSTPEQIDQIFALFTEDFTYVHPKYGGTYTREDLYNGYKRNQANGGYDGSVMDILEFQRITGLNGVVVERSYVTKEESGITQGEKQMTLFEFRDGKISRIFEYW